MSRHTPRKGRKGRTTSKQHASQHAALSGAKATSKSKMQKEAAANPAPVEGKKLAKSNKRSRAK